jgi:hypothetical protein
MKTDKQTPNFISGSSHLCCSKTDHPHMLDDPENTGITDGDQKIRRII